MTVRLIFPERSYGIAPSGYRLPEATRLGAVHLQVGDLGRSVAYYSDVLGLRVLNAKQGVAHMAAHGDDRELIVLHELVNAKPVPRRGRLGLFHVAILLPDRASLGRFLAHLAERGEQPGMSDHLVSEAIYLTDPDGLGLEIYADRSRSAWQTQPDRQIAMSTMPLDVRAVIASAGGEDWNGAPAGTAIGHVHLHVGSLSGAEQFYHNALGFDKIVWGYPGALFLSAGGYHHHLGTNTWARDAESAHADEARLLEWTIEVPSTSDVNELAASLTSQGIAVAQESRGIVLRDPWNTSVRVVGTHDA